MNMSAIELKIVNLGDPAPWADIADKTVHHVTTGLRLAALEAGTTGGHPSIALAIPLPDGSFVVYEMTLAVLRMAMAGIKGRFPE